MSGAGPHPRLGVVVVGGGVAALETALALHDLAGAHTEVTVIAPNREFVYRPLTVQEPFAYGRASRFELAQIIRAAGAELLADELSWIDPSTKTLHTRHERTVAYDVLVLAHGARIRARYDHALTIDDRRLDDLLHGVVEDIEGGYLNSLAFVVPPRMAWPLPLYELALMTAARAYDAGVQLATTIVTPEDGPLAIFGQTVAAAVAELLREAGVETITSAYCEVTSSREVVVSPGNRHLEVDRVIALPELYGPCVRGIPLGQYGFIPVDLHGRVRGVENVYAAGDATEFPVKHGGIAAQQADAVAESIAADSGAAVTPRRFDPVIRGILMTGGRPRYLTAQLTGGHGFSSELSETPSWSPPSKIAAKYLGPYLASHARDRAASLQ